MTLFDQALPQYPDEPYRRLSPPLYILLSSCKAWPFSWRKLALTVCRVQQDSEVNYRLEQEINAIRSDESFVNFVQDPLYRNTISFDQVLSALNDISTSPILCSILSYFTRAEELSDENDYTIQKDKVIKKELSAALHEDNPQALDWSALTLAKPLYPDGLPGASCKFTMEAWRQGVSRLKRVFASQQHIFIPHYNRRKNVGWLTQDYALIQPHGFEFVPRGQRSMTQKQLIIEYHTSGLMVAGPMEMRFAWRYNDLKGRCYYATGGTSLWKGLFIKAIVKDLLNLLPSTSTYSRYDVNRVTFTPLQAGECVITYDFSSFTTSLSELKYFLVYLARQLEGVTFRYLDVYQGVVEADLGDYINEYNDSININAEFDYTRLDVVESLVVLHQCRSGMLGAQGNIGFSTLLHGLGSSGISDDPGSSCIVGDDALLRQWARLIALCISRAQMLAPIESSKFHVWEHHDMYSEEGVFASNANAWQFLKRPLKLGMDAKVKAGFLLAYPSIAEALMPPDKYHTANTSPSPATRFTRCAKQWGSFLNKLYYTDYEIDTDEAQSLLAPMISVYEKYKVPLEGAPVGSTLVFEGEEFIFPFTIPPVKVEVFNEHWVDSHARFFHGTYISVPVMVDFSVPSPECYGIGHEWTCTMHRIQRVMEDLGYFRSEIVKRVIQINEETKDDLMQVTFGRARMLHKVTCVQEPPDWYNDIIADEGPF